MSADREALRQQMLLRALLGDARPAVVGGWMRDGARFERGLAAYKANAGALAERALAAAFPTLQQLLGDESFAALARTFWRRHPPERGDVATWGEHLSSFIADDETLAPEPYLADVARLEWAVHACERAADAAGVVEGLDLLASHDPAALRLRFAPGLALVASPHPVATIWQAHRSDGDDADRFAPVRAAFAEGRGEPVLVARSGWQAHLRVIGQADARFVQALLEDHSLGAALDAAGPSFDFGTWLADALRGGWLRAVEGASR